MIKAIKVLYAVNIALFVLLVPLSVFLFSQSINAFAESAKANSEDAEVVGVIFATLFYAIIQAIFWVMFIVFDAISLILAIIGLVKICRAKTKKNMKAIAIVQIIFLGNIVPAIMSLAIKEEEFNNLKTIEESNSLENNE